MNKFKAHSRGASIIEFLIVIGILSLVSLGIFDFGRNLFTFSTVIRNGLSAQQDARKLVRTMVTELRTSSISSSGAYPIYEAATSSIGFFSDIDGDGLKEEVRYYLSNGFLLKAVRVPSGAPPTYSGSASVSTLVVDMRNGTNTPIFSYYDTNYDGTSAPLSLPINIPAVRLIRITLFVDKDPYRSPIPVSVTTQVSLRNLKDNL